MRFRDRADAGRRLAGLLLPYRGADVRVLGLARGGVRVAFEVARALEAPLDMWVARHLGSASNAPNVGAVSEGGGLYLDSEAARLSLVPEVELRALATEELSDIERHARQLRDRPPPEVRGCTVLLVDDGMVTGSTLCASIRALRQLGPRRIVAGAGVATARALEVVRAEADAVLCVEVSPGMGAVSEAYDDFRPVTDVEMEQLLEVARLPAPSHAVLDSTDLGGRWM
ncbi:phosphoribosyl transferase [Corallococcus sp. H22C18031201]|uniref:phosphoribosyltransferase n=1 Tax=Citreicoccus inhibens TaxID=2849499 RepID=UPI000E70D558|nr:phosphoribosyltransferase family protein [Citreicoccus inhibens]MBU8896770.1 phosphoribosyl transferase [Citreicoccus inhibens]RJS21934.1 phosphoribosyl transferase [Corallococcus sp. H22C18031201]